MFRHLNSKFNIQNSKLLILRSITLPPPFFFLLCKRSEPIISSVVEESLKCETLFRHRHSSFFFFFLLCKDSPCLPFRQKNATLQGCIRKHKCSSPPLSLSDNRADVLCQARYPCASGSSAASPFTHATPCDGLHANY